MGSFHPSRLPLYPEPPWLYWDVEAVIVLALFDQASVSRILPDGLEPSGETVLGAVWVSRYPRSTLGPYNEALVALQVFSERGPVYYIPYIYVDNDAALAAGREVAGAQKKLATISIAWEGRSVVGRMERAGARIEAIVAPEAQADDKALEALLSPEGVPLASLRVLPSIPGGPGLGELVLWRARVWLHRSMGGRVKAWTGPAMIRLRAGVEDRLDALKVVEVLDGFYTVFDMELSIDGTLWRREV